MYSRYRKLANDNRYQQFLLITRIALLLAFCVIVLGAYVRLSDAGLGCPDWPGCYGQLLGVPEDAAELAQAERDYPQRAVVVHAAWKEMTHRYFAGALGLLVLALAVLALRNRRNPQQPVTLPILLLVLIIFQALLGMWTVTLQLKPLIVMAHLLGGFATLSLLWWLNLRGARWSQPGQYTTGGYHWALLGLLVLVGQIALGGWTSSNYAALACPDFPTCQAAWWPKMDFREAFVLWRGLGINYEFGVLDNPARTAIHMVHRIGAAVTGLYLAVFALATALRSNGGLRTASGMILALLATQIALGISNVVLHLPLAVAVAHNGTAALLLLSLLAVIYMLKSPAHEPA